MGDKMNLSISNIAWASENDECMYDFLQESGLKGLEIAPTRLFPQNPYDNLDRVKEFSENLRNKYNLSISSIQSLWYGVNTSIFGSDEDREFLIRYTKKAIDFANIMNCKNLVFGCPKNRVIQDDSQYAIAVSFFKELGEYARSRSTVVSIEPNPTIYNTNFINHTAQAFEICTNVDCEGFRVNVDLGTIIFNSECLQEVAEKLHLVNHIHISEPNLVLIQKRGIHKELANLIKDKFNKYISIEMGKRENLEEVKETIKYINEVFS